MPVTGDRSTNLDKTENISITAIKELDGGNISLTGFANGVMQGYDPMKPNAPAYSNAGLSLAGANSLGSASLTGVNIPNSANVLTASTSLNLVNNDIHRLTANANTSSIMPKAGPNFAQHGGGLDYSYKNTVGANASISHTPVFKQTDYNLGGSLTLHQTPTSSLGINLGANRTDRPFNRGNWQPAASLQFTKTFK